MKENKINKYQSIAEGLEYLVPKLEMLRKAYFDAHVEFTWGLGKSGHEQEVTEDERMLGYSEEFQNNLEGLCKEVAALKARLAYYQTNATLFKEHQSSLN